MFVFPSFLVNRQLDGMWKAMTNVLLEAYGQVATGFMQLDKPVAHGYSLFLKRNELQVQFSNKSS